MPRPAPEILIEKIDPKTFIAKQVCKADGFYVVLYDGHPINLRTFYYATNIGPQYKRLGWSNPGHAINMAEYLNKLFNTNKFTTYEIDLSAIKRIS